MKRTVFLLSLTLIAACLTIGAAFADDVAAVNAMLDNIQKAHKSHDIELLGAQYDENILLVGDHPDASKGAFFLQRDQILMAIQNQTWRAAGLVTRTISKRRIAVRNDLAFIRMVIKDQFKNGKTDSSEQLVVAVKRDSKWRACFAMPAIMEARILVASVESGSAAEKAGLKKGDFIVACNGEPVDPALFGSDPKSVLSGQAGSQVSLRVHRPGSDVVVQAPSGLEGAKLEATLVPDGSGRLVADDAGHPVKDLLTKEIDLLKSGTADGYREILCQSGYFSYRRESGGYASLVTGTNAQQTIAKQLSESRNALDASTIRLERVDVIAGPNIPLATGTIQASDRNGASLRVPTRLQVYARNGKEWRLVANLVDRFTMASAGGKEVALSAEQTSQSKQNQRGTIVGIGARLAKHPEGLFIEQALPGQPAEKAGVRRGEVIVAADGRSTKDMPVEEGVKAITGEEGTQVTLELLETSGNRRTVTIKRETIKLPWVVTDMLQDDIGYVGISTVNQETPNAVSDALTKILPQRKARGIVLDLRGNDGGLYSEIVKIAEMLIDGTTPKLLWIVRQEGKAPVPVEAKSAALTALPCVVLIDDKTKGGAELLAAALSQAAGATLVGTKTAGGAVLKEQIANEDGSSRIVETGDFLFPKTGKTGTDGVVPDIAAPDGATPEQVLELGRKTLAGMLTQ
jgi:C-terminal peptidase prc